MSLGLFSDTLILQGAGPGWEELVDAAVTHLLRTSLAKSSKDQQQQVSLTPSLEMPRDTHKLKKHLALLCDRVSKGFLPSGKQPVSMEVSITSYIVCYSIIMLCVCMLQATQSLTAPQGAPPAEDKSQIQEDRHARAVLSGFSTDGRTGSDGNSVGTSYRKPMSRQPTMPALPEHSAEDLTM